MHSDAGATEEEEWQVYISVVEGATLGLVYAPRFSELREAIEADKFKELEEKEFSFAQGERNVPMTVVQEARLICKGEKAKVRIFEKPCARPSRTPETIDVDDEEVTEEPLLGLRSKLIQYKEQKAWLHRFSKLKEKLFSKLQHEQFEVISYDKKGVGYMAVYCHDCGKDMGAVSQLKNALRNYQQHLKSSAHKQNREKRLSESGSRVGSSTVDATEESQAEVPNARKRIREEEDKECDRVSIEEEVFEILATTVHDIEEETGLIFSLYTPSIDEYEERNKINVLREKCQKLILMFPKKGSLENNIRTHLDFQRHVGAVLGKLYFDNPQTTMQEAHENGKREKVLVADKGDPKLDRWFAKVPGKASSSKGKEPIDTGISTSRK